MNFIKWWSLTLLMFSQGRTTPINTIYDYLFAAYETALTNYTDTNNVLQIGDSVTIDDITLTILNLSVTDERNQFEDEPVDYVIEVQYELFNDSKNDYLYGTELQLYADNKKSEPYPLSSSFGSLSPGRIVEAKQYFGFNGSPMNLEIEFRPNFLSDQETEINGNGPIVGGLAFKQLLDYLQDELEQGDVVFLGGNTSPGMDSSAYVSIAKLCLEKEVKLVLDTNKALLTECLQYRPFIIKPNQHELCEIFDIEMNTDEDVIKHACKLQVDGARNVLVSLGGDGAILVTESGEIYKSSVPKGVVLNSVGAGDSMIGGFMAKFIETGDYKESLRQGAATGSATAFSIGIANLQLVNMLLPQVDVNRLD